MALKYLGPVCRYEHPDLECRHSAASLVFGQIQYRLRVPSSRQSKTEERGISIPGETLEVQMKEAVHGRDVAH